MPPEKFGQWTAQCRRAVGLIHIVHGDLGYCEMGEAIGPALFGEGLHRLQRCIIFNAGQDDTAAVANGGAAVTLGVNIRQGPRAGDSQP